MRTEILILVIAILVVALYQLAKNSVHPYRENQSGRYGKYLVGGIFIFFALCFFLAGREKSSSTGGGASVLAKGQQVQKPVEGKGEGFTWTAEYVPTSHYKAFLIYDREQPNDAPLRVMLASTGRDKFQGSYQATFELDSLNGGFARCNITVQWTEVEHDPNGVFAPSEKDHPSVQYTDPQEVCDLIGEYHQSGRGNGGSNILADVCKALKSILPQLQATYGEQMGWKPAPDPKDPNIEW